MKRLITLFAAIAFAGQVWAQDYDFVVDNLAYTITDAENYEVSVGQTETTLEGDLVIPAEVENEGVTYMVTSIDEENAFCGCFGLTSVTIPISIKTIGDFAFDGCIGLTNVIIPNSVTGIGESAFRSVKNIVYSGSAKGSPWGALNVNAIPDETGFIYFDAEKTKLTAYVGDENEVVIPNSVLSIGNYAFSSCSSLASVNIPNSVTSIGDGAFGSCSNLASVNIPNSVMSIGEKAFGGCSSLTSVTIPDSVKTIGDGAFYDCRALASVNIPDSVKTIGNHVFWECVSLTSVTIPEGVTSIGDYAFLACYGLTSVTIPNSVSSIGYAAFDYCSGLKSVTIPNSVTSIGKYAFGNVKNIVYSGNAEGRPWGALNVNAIPDKEGFIYSDAEKKTLTAYVGDGGEVVIPSAVINIGKYAFYHCTNLTSVTIPNTVNTIGDRAFAGCTATIYCDFEKKPGDWDRDWCGEEYKGEIVWKTATPVTESAANAVYIYAYGKNIVVENATEGISVYDVMGRLVCRDAARHVSTININGTGVYIVKVGNIAKRVVISQK